MRCCLFPLTPVNIVAEERALQLKNASLPIYSTVSGIVTDVISKSLAKAESAMTFMPPGINMSVLFPV